jgi:hypothetical protein
MDTTIQPTNQQLIYPHLALFDPPDVEREVVESERRTGELVEILRSGEETPHFDERADEIQYQKSVVRASDPELGVSYGSAWREQMMSNLDIWI